MKSALRLLLTLFTILCSTTISGASIQESQAGVIFEEAGASRGGIGFFDGFIAPSSGGNLFSKTTGGQAMNASERARFIEMSRRHGVQIETGSGVDKFLSGNGAHAMTFGDDAILLHSKATRSAAFEDFIHIGQKQSGMFTGKNADIMMEIDALETLIKYRKPFKIPNIETRESIQLLRGYRNQLGN